jgi:sporulation protein YlmC with PRC-barrel domain
MAIIKDMDVTGKRVILEDACDVGTLIEVHVDTLDWRITKFDIKLEKRYAARVGVDAGLLKKPIITVPIHLLKSVGDVVHLKGTIDDLAKTQKTILPAAERRKEQEREAAAATKSKKAPKAKKGKKAPPPPPPPPPPPKMAERKDKPRSL